MKNILVTTILISIALVTTPAKATVAGPGFAIDVYTMANGAVIFSFVDASGNYLTRSSVPACATNQSARWAIDASTLAGQETAEFLLKAWQNHVSIGTVFGTGTCTIWSDTETVSYLGHTN